MSQALSLKTFSVINDGLHIGRLFTIPGGAARFYATTHTEIAASDLAHYHDEPHVTFVLSGGVVDKRRDRDSSVGPGGLMYFRAGEVHQTIGRVFPTTYLSLQLDEDFYRREPLAERRLATAIADGSGAKATMVRIYRELAIADEYSAQSVEMLVRGLVDGGAETFRRPPEWLARVTEILRDRWNDEVSVESLAAETGVHPKTVSREFPRFFGCTLGEFRRRIKIEHALGLIRGGRRPLTEIAFECGFYDQSHFIRTFKDATGLRPAEFRRLA